MAEPSLECALISSLNLLNHQRAVLGSKSDAITQRHAHVGFAGIKRHVIKIAIGIRFIEINRGRNDASAHGTKRSPETGSAARSLRVAHLGFSCRHWDAG